MRITSEQFDLSFLPFEKSFVYLLLDLLNVHIRNMIGRFCNFCFDGRGILSGNFRENLVNNEIRHAGKCRHDGQIEYRADTHYDYENEIRRTRIRTFLQDHEPRDHRHEQSDDNDYRQQNCITVDLAEIHCIISVVSAPRCFPTPAFAEWRSG